MTDRELDALVAEKVMGDVEWDVVIEGSSRAGLRCATREEAEAQKPQLAERYHVGPVVLHGDVPEYSTDIAAAWLVVEKMRQKGYSVRIDCQWGKIGGEPWDVWFRGGRSGTQRLSLSLPHGICLAAVDELTRDDVPAGRGAAGDTK